jgi:hypothetical protein
MLIPIPARKAPRSRHHMAPAMTLGLRSVMVLALPTRHLTTRQASNGNLPQAHWESSGPRPCHQGDLTMRPLLRHRTTSRKPYAKENQAKLSQRSRQASRSARCVGAGTSQRRFVRRVAAAITPRRRAPLVAGATSPRKSVPGAEGGATWAESTVFSAMGLAECAPALSVTGRGRSPRAQSVVVPARGVPVNSAAGTDSSKSKRLPAGDDSKKYSRGRRPDRQSEMRS